MKYFFTFLCCLGCFVFQACSSDNGDCEPGPIQNPNQQATIDGTIYRESALDCRLPKVQTFQVNGASTTDIVAEQGTVLMINPQAFTQVDGSPIQGDLTVSLLEMYQPGEIIACQLSTNGLNNSQSVEPLLSEGIFYLDITYNNQSVIINENIQIFVPSENQDLELSFFNSPSCPELDCKVLWEINTEANIYNESYTDAAGNTTLGYRVFFQTTGWLSIARYNDSQEARGILYNKALEGYTTENSNTFLKYDSNSLAIGMFSDFDAENGVFSEKYAQIPINTSGDVIFVSKPAAEFKYDSQAVTTENGKITLTRDLRTGSENTLVDYINNL